MVCALFVRKDSIYKSLLGESCCWDFDRDATTYAGVAPVVAHPPCGVWGRFKRHVERKSGRMAEEDRRCGLSAVASVRRWGGVLEQPATSELWSAAGIPLRGVDCFGGYTLQVCQSWWGHKAEKCTWLYVVNGCADLPGYDYDFSVPEFGLLQLGRREREATPLDFARWLVALAAGSSVAICAGVHSAAGPFDLAARASGHSIDRPFARAASQLG